jgi:hypothetical protein
MHASWALTPLKHVYACFVLALPMHHREHLASASPPSYSQPLYICMYIMPPRLCIMPPAYSDAFITSSYDGGASPVVTAAGVQSASRCDAARFCPIACHVGSIPLTFSSSTCAVAVDRFGFCCLSASTTIRECAACCRCRPRRERMMHSHITTDNTMKVATTNVSVAAK